MIRCSQCKSLWAGGTTWCGNCCATLGCRICEDGHSSPLSAKCCVTCGSKKLSNGVGATQLRTYSTLVTLVIVAGLVVLAFPLVFQSGKYILRWVISTLMPYVLLSLAIALFGGPKAKGMVGRIWQTALTLLFSTCAKIFRLFFKRSS